MATRGDGLFWQVEPTKVAIRIRIKFKANTSLLAIASVGNLFLPYISLRLQG